MCPNSTDDSPSYTHIRYMAQSMWTPEHLYVMVEQLMSFQNDGALIYRYNSLHSFGQAFPNRLAAGIFSHSATGALGMLATFINTLRHKCL